MNDGLLNKDHDTLGNKLGEVKDTIGEIKDKVIEVRDRVIEVKDTVAERGDATAEKVRRFAKAHPLKAIGIAFAIGYFGMRMTRPLRWL